MGVMDVLGKSCEKVMIDLADDKFPRSLREVYLMTHAMSYHFASMAGLRSSMSHPCGLVSPASRRTYSRPGIPSLRRFVPPQRYLA
jgi:hypothetical protein